MFTGTFRVNYGIYKANYVFGCFIEIINLQLIKMIKTKSKSIKTT